MSTQYESLPLPHLYPDAFGVPAPLIEVPRELWRRQPGVFIRRLETAAPVVEPSGDADPATATEADAAGAPAVPTAPAVAPTVQRELVAGQLGLAPRWAKSASDAHLRGTKLVNARAETVTTSNNFRDAWLAGQRCIVPMQSFLEDDFRSGKAVPTRITRIDGKPMGVAGLWECWEGKDGETIVSYTLLTVNANSHALLHRYQQPGAEKRMLAVLNEGAFDAWLGARVDKAKEFLRPYPATQLTANPVEKKKRDPRT